MIITRRILIQVAVGTVAVLTIATVTTYNLVRRTAQHRAISFLGDYVAERGRSQEKDLRQVENNLKMVRDLFLKRDGRPVSTDLEKGWLQQNELHPDGAWRTRRQGWDPRTQSSMWIRSNAPVTFELKTRLLRVENILNDFILGWVDTFPSLYFIFPEQVNIGFDARIPNWVWDAKGDYDTCAAEYYQEATPAKNPTGHIVWGSSTREPVSQVPYVNVTLPIWRGTNFIGIVGHDIAVRDLQASTARPGLRGVTTIIFRRDGPLIAHPGLEEKILASDGKLTMEQSGDPMLQSIYRGCLMVTPKQYTFAGTVGSGDHRVHFAAMQWESPSWFLVGLLPDVQLRRDAAQSAQWVLWSGLVSLALVLGLFAWILRRQIAQPVAELARVTRQFASGDNSARAHVTRQDELGALADAFNDMAASVEARGKELRALNQTLEQRVAERTAKLKESEARFAKAFQASPASIVLTRLEDAVVVAANEAFLATSGYSESEVIGKTVKSLNVYAVPEQRDEYLKAIRERGFVRDREQLLRTKTGDVRTILLAGELVELDGQPHLLTAGLDITGRKEAEVETLKALEREKELSELKSTFVSMVSHEFRTPLGVIMSATEVLQRYFERLSPDKRARHLDMIFRSTRNLATIIEEVLLLGRVEDGRMHCSPAPIALATFCRSLADEVTSATQGVCPIRFTAPQELEEAIADESLLRHILSNLLCNAVKYSEPGTLVEFSIERHGPDAVFTIRDHGIGIPAEDRDRIFHSFARGRNVGERPGTGLGLVIVQRCVRLHGGELNLDSEVDQGTTVTVRLPLFSGSSLNGTLTSHFTPLTSPTSV